MNSLNKWMLIIFVLLGFSGFSQQQKFDYKRKITFTEIYSKWKSIELPEAVYDKIKPDLTDIRIFQLSEKDTVEVPYFIQQNPVALVPEKLDATLINQSKTSHGYYFTFEKQNPQAYVDKIDLNFANANFDWKITLEGSLNQHDWYTLLEDYRILSIKNPQTDYRFQKLVFPKTNFTFYRVFIPTTDNPALESFALNHSLTAKQDYKQVKVVDFDINTDSKKKTTEVVFSLNTKLPVQSVLINIDQKSDFYRPVKIEYLVDSVQTEKGWRKNYALFTTATISSVEKTAFSKNNHTPVLARNFRITIQNQDNPALQIKDIEVNYLADRLIFQAEKEKEYYLFYGNSNSRKPLYDIERFKENIIALQTFDEAALGNEIVLDNSQKQALPLFQNKLWLWAVMLIVILILGFFSYKMISKK